MDQKDPAIAELVTQLTGCQPRLYAYIVALTGDHHQAEDVLEQTNLVIWEKADQFAGSENFEARACKVAYYQVLASRRDAQRNQRRLIFDDDLLERMARVVSVKLDPTWDNYLEGLRDCMTKLPEVHRQLLRKRYGPGGSVQAMAAARGESPDATSALLYRIRKRLLECIRRHDLVDAHKEN